MKCLILIALMLSFPKVHGLADLESGFHDVQCQGIHCTYTDVPEHPKIDNGLIEVEGHVHGATCQNGQCTFIN